jgi:hypothetical protein
MERGQVVNLESSAFGSRQPVWAVVAQQFVSAEAARAKLNARG